MDPENSPVSTVRPTRRGFWVHVGPVQGVLYVFVGIVGVEGAHSFWSVEGQEHAFFAGVFFSVRRDLLRRCSLH